MGEACSKQKQKGQVIISPYVQQTPVLSRIQNIYKPTFKAKFSYLNPLNHNLEEHCEDGIQKENIKTQISIQNQSQKNILCESSTVWNLESCQQIKVKWNTFVKMKKKNYLNDYQVLKKIGKGGFGIVSKVKSIYTHVIRAAKIIKKKDLKQNEHKKLLQEMTIMTALDHPNIIKLYEVYDYQNQYVLILQLCEGGELYKRIKKKKLPQKIIRKYIIQLIKTLIYLHTQGIVHRDLKPQNMLFESQGSETLKIIDFGIATRMKQNQEQFLTDRIGTPYYLAPQVIYKKYRQTCDIWSTGVIFYMMVSGGQPPFKGNTQVDLLQNILRQQPSFQGSAWKKVSQQCKNLVKSMLTKKVSQRPTARYILQNDWFKIQSVKKLQPDQQLEVLTNIRHFNFHNKLQAVVHTFIASQLLQSSQKQILLGIFKQLDKNNDGVISTQQLKEALQKQKKIKPERVYFLLNLIDTNKSGQIQYTQFLVAGLGVDEFMKKQYFQKAFAYFDIDHSGSITYEEVVEFLQNYEQSEDQIRKLFQQVDSNGDGQISQEQFVQLFIKKTQAMKTQKLLSINQQNENNLRLIPERSLKVIHKQMSTLRNLQEIDQKFD